MATPSEKHSIRLEGIEVTAPVGYYAEERETGVPFLITLELCTDFSGTEMTDDITHTINYEEIVRLIRDEMAVPAKLIEHVAYRIKNKLTGLFPSIISLRLELRKLHPPLELKTAAATVVIDYTK